MMRTRQGCVVVLVGPPGSGKSDWTQKNSMGAIVVSQDDLIDAITPGGFEVVCRLVYAVAEDATAHTGVEAWIIRSMRISVTRPVIGPCTGS